MEFYASGRKKELLPFGTAWMELESIILCEISQAGERQIPYGLTFNRNLINKTNKQNITKNTEIENRLTVTRGEGEGISGEKGERFVGTIIKDTWTIMGVGGGNGRELGRAWSWGGVGGKGRELYLNNNKILNKGKMYVPGRER